MAKQKQVQITVGAKDDTGAALTAVNKSLEALEKRTKSLGRSIAGAFTGLVSLSTLKSISQINSEWVDMSSRLRRVTKDEAEFVTVTERLGEVAESTWSGLNETIESYLSMQGPLADMGYTTEEQVNFVSALNNALVVSGAKKEVAASVQNALNKAMAGGVLRGENLNTVIEKGGRVAELLASTLGVTVSELRALGTQGKITGEVMYSALAGNMQLLSEEADAMPATFEDAMQRVEESIKGAFRDDELMEPLTDSLLELAEVLKDPSVRQGLANLATGLAGAATAVVEATSEFGGLGHELGYMAAAATGNVTYLDKLEKEIKDVDKALNNSFMSKPIRFLFDSEEELKELRASLIAKRDAVVEYETGISAEMRQIEEDRQKEIERRQRLEKQLRNNHISELKQFTKDTVKAIQERGKELAKAEKEAAKELKLAQKETQRVAQKFEDVRQAIKSARTPEKEASVLDYYDLRASAEQALKKGDTEKAKKDAEAAAEVLAKLAEAGKAEYRFGGMLNDVEKIGKAAAEIEETQAAEKLQSIKTEMEALAATAKELEEIEITPALDEEALATVESELKAALAALKSDAVIPVRITTSESSSSEPQGFARGGYIRGPGTGTSDSILARLSDGEFVMRAKAVQKYGLQTLHAMNNMRLPGFADGGLVERIASAEPAAPKSMGTINFNLPNGDNFAVQAADANWDELKRAALKFGRPVRR